METVESWHTPLVQRIRSTHQADQPYERIIDALLAHIGGEMTAKLNQQLAIRDRKQFDYLIDELKQVDKFLNVLDYDGPFLLNIDPDGGVSVDKNFPHLPRKRRAQSGEKTEQAE